MRREYSLRFCIQVWCHYVVFKPIQSFLTTHWNTHTHIVEYNVCNTNTNILLLPSQLPNQWFFLLFNFIFLLLLFQSSSLQPNIFKLNSHHEIRIRKCPNTFGMCLKFWNRKNIFAIVHEMQILKSRSYRFLFFLFLISLFVDHITKKNA